MNDISTTYVPLTQNETAVNNRHLVYDENFKLILSLVDKLKPVSQLANFPPPVVQWDSLLTICPSDKSSLFLR